MSDENILMIKDSTVQDDRLHSYPTISPCEEGCVPLTHGPHFNQCRDRIWDIPHIHR